MTPKEIYKKYSLRIMSIMKRIHDVLAAAGFMVDEPGDANSDDYRFDMMVDFEKELGKDKNVIISFEICESENCDGSKNGVNFAVHVVDFGGKILGGMTPYNYSKDCWVDRYDHAGIEERFTLMEQADPTTMGGLLQFHLKYEKGEVDRKTGKLKEG